MASGSNPEPVKLRRCASLTDPPAAGGAASSRGIRRGRSGRRPFCRGERVPYDGGVSEEEILKLTHLVACAG